MILLGVVSFMYIHRHSIKLCTRRFLPCPITQHIWIIYIYLGFFDIDCAFSPFSQWDVFDHINKIYHSGCEHHGFALFALFDFSSKGIHSFTQGGGVADCKFLQARRSGGNNQQRFTKPLNNGLTI